MSEINEKHIIERYLNNESTYQIAESLKTYTKKIERILKKNGIKLRSRSEAQKLALESGRNEHPTKGRKRTQEEKLKISDGVHKNWKNMDEEKRQEFKEGAKERWNNMSGEKKRQMQELAGRALHQTSKEGSKIEKSLQKMLMEMGYDVIMHKKNLIEGNFEIDLFLPALNTIIEVDGPQHFLPVFGELKLQETIKADSKKNGLLVSKGYCVIRIKFLKKNCSFKTQRTICSLVEKEISKIEEKFPPKQKRLIELEINDGHS